MVGWARVFIDGDYGDDSLLGDGGADTITGGQGNDKIEGGDGNDNIDGGNEADSLLGGAGDDSISGGDGDDHIDGGDEVFGEDGNDSIIAGEGDDSVQGDDGNDTIEGGSGNDYIRADAGDDSVDGGIGDDEIYGSSGADRLVGGDGADTINAYGGDDSISGGDGNDLLVGGSGNDTLDAGTDDDFLVGEGGDDTFVYNVGDGNNTITDFNTGNTGTLDDGDSANNDYIDLSGYYDHLSELYADQADDGILNQSNATDTRGFSTDYADNDQFGSGSLTMQGASADEASFTAENTGVTCFTIGTAIRTPRGDVLIEELSVGDLVTNADNGPQPIRWIGTRMLDHRTLLAEPSLRPVLIKAQALGNERALLVSPQHCLMIREDRLVRAKHLAETQSGVRIAHGKRHVCYIHLMFDAHQIIFAESVPAESFYPGPTSLLMMSSDTCLELFTLFPALEQDPDCRAAIVRNYGATVRNTVKKRDVIEVLSHHSSQIFDLRI